MGIGREEKFDLLSILVDSRSDPRPTELLFASPVLCVYPIVVQQDHVFSIYLSMQFFCEPVQFLVEPSI